MAHAGKRQAASVVELEGQRQAKAQRCGTQGALFELPALPGHATALQPFWADLQCCKHLAEPAAPSDFSLAAWADHAAADGAALEPSFGQHPQFRACGHEDDDETQDTASSSCSAGSSLHEAAVQQPAPHAVRLGDEDSVTSTRPAAGPSAAFSFGFVRAAGTPLPMCWAGGARLV